MLIFYSWDTTPRPFYIWLLKGHVYNFLPVLWTWIRLDVALLDPDLFWESGSASRSMGIDQNYQWNLISAFQKRLFTFLGMFFDLFLRKYFYVKIQLFVTSKPEQDQDPDPRWFGSIDPDLDPHRYKQLDPDPHWNQREENPMQIHKTGFYLWICVRKARFTDSRHIFTIYITVYSENSIIFLHRL